VDLRPFRLGRGRLEREERSLETLAASLLRRKTPFATRTVHFEGLKDFVETLRRSFETLERPLET
jgi:hypothetical protein